MLLKCPNTCMKGSICRQSFTRWLDPPSCYIRRKCYPPNNAQNLSCIRKHIHIHNYIGWTLVHHMTHSRKHFAKYLNSQIMEYTMYIIHVFQVEAYMLVCITLFWCGRYIHSCATHCRSVYAVKPCVYHTILVQ